MKRRLPGISATVEDSRPAVPDGVFLVRLDHAQHRWHPQKPFYVLRLLIVEPNQFAGLPLVSRLYCTTKAMWKLGWFLRDFLYDPESLTRDEIDEKALPALGAEIYASAIQKKGCFHTCKSRACPSCGHRATPLWQREQWASLPDMR